ncbi:MAG: deoxyribodipyrimidine photo-lyase [Candidatus Kapaibacterium sp.]
MPEKTGILKVFWFRKDLRIFDNRALSHLINDINPGDKYLFIYIKNKDRLKFYGEMRLAFLKKSLEELSSTLKEKNLSLSILKGNSVEAFSMLLSKYKQISVCSNRQIEPYSVSRDKKVSELLNQSASELKLYSDTMLFEPNEIVKDDGTPYSVFTPFSKKCYSLLNENHYSDSRTLIDKLNPENCIKLKSEKLESYIPSPIFKGGRQEGLEFLKDFFNKGLSKYKSQRDFPAIKGTSLMSPHLHFGTVNIRECWRAALKKIKEKGDSPEVKTWMNELLWREFYYHITFHSPYVIDGAFKPVYDKLKWNYDKTLFKKWCEGMTGYPIVDAGMRQLNKEGWIHNRVRMVVAMFLTKDLFIDWKWGEKYFTEKLVDLDFASNNGGWQWSASTGCDAQPYFRIFNPYLQSARFDAKGDYIRKYVKEIRNVPEKFIHKPDDMTKEQYIEYGASEYPKPLIDHHSAKERTISRFKKLSENK